MNNNLISLNSNEIDIEDVFGAHIVDGAEYDTECGYDIPFTEVPCDVELPEELVSYSKLGTFEKKARTFCHFYQKDYTFDGVYGIWNSLMWNREFKKGFSLEKLKNVDGIICPDFSTYYDMPRVMQIWNVYRSRAVGYYFNSRGFIAIPNVRWTDEASYIYSFAGLKKKSIVAVGNVGCLRSNADKELFFNGLKKLIVRVEPSVILLYGTLNDEIKELFDLHNQRYKFFQSDISIAHGGNR